MLNCDLVNFKNFTQIVICKTWNQLFVSVGSHKRLNGFLAIASVAQSIMFLGMAAMPIPLWCPFDIVDDSLA